MIKASTTYTAIDNQTEDSQ